MAKRSNASVLKRLREVEKRARQATRTAKAALKRERRAQRRSAEAPPNPGEDAPDQVASIDFPAAAADQAAGTPAPDSEAC